MKGWIAVKGGALGGQMFFRVSAISAVTDRGDGGAYIWGPDLSENACFVTAENPEAVMRQIAAAEADTEPF